MVNKPQAAEPTKILPASTPHGEAPLEAVAEVVGPSFDIPGGRYRVEGEIARGGMGAIFKGHDTELGRDIALKVLLESHAEKSSLAQRFVEEARIAGQLQHPGITPVYEMGKLADRRPYFTMKLVKGETLKALLEKRQDPGHDRPRFLKIFEQVCQTLSYAHARGVIHRDLKPANVMVGAFGEVQVMDWGLAKVLARGQDAIPAPGPSNEAATLIRTGRGDTPESMSHTQTGCALGTPAYMPPEQALGETDRLDARADVFGLGSILCEILTGRPPYEGPDQDAVVRKSIRGDLADAFSHLDTCGADPEIIHLARRCLAVEPAARPNNAGALTKELTAYLESVEARLRQAELAGAEARARAFEESKRRRLSLALAGSILAMALLVSGGWVWLASQRAEQARQQAADEQEKILRERAEEEKRAQRRQQIVERLNRAKSLGAQADRPQAREQVQRALALLEVDNADPLLLAEAKDLQKLLDAEDKNQQLLARLENARLVAAELDPLTGLFAEDRILPRYRAAFGDYGWKIGKQDVKSLAVSINQLPVQVREPVLAALDQWSLVGRRNLDPDQTWVSNLLEAADPKGWNAQVRQTDELPQPRRRAALEKIAGEAKVSDLAPAAIVELAKRLQGAQAESLGVRLLQMGQEKYTGDFWINEHLGLALARMAANAEAVRFLTAATALRPKSAAAQINLGYALGLGGRLADAKAAYEKAIALNPNSSAAYDNLGNILRRQNNVDDAIRAHNKAIALDPNNASAFTNLGFAYHAKKNWQEGIDCHLQAIAINPKLAQAYNNLGAALQGRGRFDEAIVQFKKAISLEPAYATAYSNLGVALQELGEIDEAIANQRKSAELQPKKAANHLNLGLSLLKKGLANEAIGCLKQAIALEPRLVQPHAALQFALLSQGQFLQSEAVGKMAQSLVPSNHPFQASIARFMEVSKQQRALEKKLPDVLAGKRELAAEDRLEFAQLCARTKRYHAAAQTYVDVFRADPKIADDLAANHRFDAARLAGLAGSGQGLGAEKLTPKDRALARQQALAWLRTDLAARQKALSAGKAERQALRSTLRLWQQNPDFIGIRDAAALAKLSAEEQASFRRFWADITAVLKKAS
jgi:serine/threonine-protein kinase